MPDLNELLRWSIANTPTQPEGTASQPLSLRFNPSTQPSSGTSALHPSDPLYRLNQGDDSPASTPGPATPQDGVAPLPRTDLNPDILDVIMGKSDSVVMKEKMAFAVDESNTVDDRIEALDDFEMVRSATADVGSS